MCIIVKVDYENVYKLVRWDFLWYMLDTLGLCGRLNGYTNVWNHTPCQFWSIFVIGSPTYEFKPTKEVI